MSDGSISQDEIDALLTGVGGADEGASNGAPASPYAQIEEFAKGNLPAFSSNLSSMTGGSVSVSGLTLEQMERESFLQKLPDMIVAVYVNFSGALEGEHIFAFTPEFAKKIIGLINHEDDVEIDDMGLSVVAETTAQFMGAEVTSLEASGFKGVVSAPPEAEHVPKAALRLPSGNFLVMSYEAQLDGNSFGIWEIVSDSAASQIISRLYGQNSAQAASVNGAAGQSAAPQQGGMQMSGMQFGMPQQPAMPQMNMTQPAGMGQYGIPQGGSMIMGSMTNPSVQQVQFPPLQNYVSQEEAGNISLIMDVYMEMTVELGRTKKMIKEILGMGEGHIIELDKLAGEPVDILVNHKPIAKGEVVVIEENFGVRVTEILSPAERIKDM